MGEELDDLRTANASGKQAKVKVPPGDPRHRRQHLPVKVILQHRRLSPRRPGPTAMRSFAQSAFVDEDDGMALFGLFFNLRPALLLPLADLVFLAFQRASHRTLTTPTQLSQNPPSLRRVILYP